MGFRKWLRRLSPRKGQRPAAKAQQRRCRPQVEWLEDRTLPTGPFLAAVHNPYLFPPRSVAVGDFNGDGKTDVAAAFNGQNSLALFQGDGAGNLTSTALYKLGDVDPWDSAVGDLNGDGDLDLAVASYAYGGVSVFWGSGLGTRSEERRVGKECRL